MKYLVDETFLKMYKETFDEYASHKSWCCVSLAMSLSASPDSDYWKCNCGFSSKVKELQELETGTVKKINENDEQESLVHSEAITAAYGWHGQG